MDYYEVMNMIKQTGQKGQELMIDAFIIGVAVGKQIIKDLTDVQNIVNQLHHLKNQIDESLVTPFKRDELFTDFINGKTKTLFENKLGDSKVKKSKLGKSTKVKKENKKQLKEQQINIDNNIQPNEQLEKITQIDQVQQEQQQQNQQEQQNQQNLIQNSYNTRSKVKMNQSIENAKNNSKKQT